MTPFVSAISGALHTSTEARKPVRVAVATLLCSVVGVVSGETIAAEHAAQPSMRLQAQSELLPQTSGQLIGQITGQPNLGEHSPTNGPVPTNAPAAGQPQEPVEDAVSLPAIGRPVVPSPAQPFAGPTSAMGSGLVVPGADTTNYILGAGDQISLSVIGYPEFTGTLALLPDGNVTLPLVGAVQAAGLTPVQLEAVLTEHMRAYLVDPVVSVGLTVMRPVVVTVAGEVHRPGPLQLTSLTSSNANTRLNPNQTEPVLNQGRDFPLTDQPAIPTLSSALLLAGGVTKDADIRQVQVRRPIGGGRSETLSFNLWETITSDAGSADIVLRDGDSIFIPELEGDLINRRTIASSSLAPSAVRVKVVGEVVRPGEVAVPPDSSISSAVAIAGGPTEDAQLGSVSLVRVADSGEIEQKDVDLSNLVDDYQVQEGDVIVVAKRGYLSVIDGIGRVLNPVNIFRLFGF